MTARAAPEADDTTTVLAYAACGTCKKARSWLDENGVKYTVRPIVSEPPTPAELEAWVAASGVPLRKWLNTSGQSYRALGKAKIDAASDAELLRLLAADGKLIKRPVLVKRPRAGGPAAAVLVGFREDEYARLFRD